MKDEELINRKDYKCGIKYDDRTPGEIDPTKLTKRKWKYVENYEWHTDETLNISKAA